MSTTQRLTLYAILTSLEEDLRQLIIGHILPNLKTGEFLKTPDIDRAVDRYLRDTAQTIDSISPEEIIQYLDLGDTIHYIGKYSSLLPRPIQTHIQQTYKALEALIPIRNRIMHSRPLEFNDYGKITDLSKSLTKSSSFIWRGLHALLRRIRENPGFVGTLSLPAAEEQQGLLNNLPSPDFDDTGFLGRDEEVADLKRQLQGPYPVITVVGEGGVGKSALVLKVAYDIVDDAEARFDAVIWVSAKANRLTPYEIETIDNAITSALGLIEAAADYLGRQNLRNPMDDLLTHLKDNKILLIIDNLEAVIDDVIRNFVRQIPLGSKVIFTTRVGLGAFDFPIKLGPFPPKDAHHYLRRTCKIWGVNDIARFPQARIEDYCKRLQYNPLFIKWFVQCIEAGQRPDAILSKPKILLEFCLQNVFSNLGDDARYIIDALLTLGSYQTQSALAFITEFRSDRLQSGLTVLLSANIIISRRSEDVGGDDEYALAPLAQFYLGNYHTPSVETQSILICRRDMIRGARDELSSTKCANVYSRQHIAVRGDGDVVVARILKRAVEALRFEVDPIDGTICAGLLVGSAAAPTS